MIGTAYLGIREEHYAYHVIDILEVPRLLLEFDE